MSVTGRNIRKILDKTGQEDIVNINVAELKKNLKFCRIEDENQWKAVMIRELVNVKQGTLYVENEDQEEFLTRTEIDEILLYVSAS